MRLTVALFSLVLCQAAIAERHEPKLNLKARPVPEFVDDAAACRAKLTLDETKLTDTEKKLFANLKDGKEVPFETVTEAWIDLHLRAFNVAHDSKLTPVFVRGMLQQIRVGAGADPFTFKKDTDLFLQKNFKKAPVSDANAKNPLDLLIWNKGDSCAGATCFSWLGRLHWGRDGYREKRPVIVTSRGRTFPAFIYPDEKGESWLVGAEGKAIGKVRELDTLPDGYRILDANTYALLEIFKPHLKPDALECWHKEALAATAKANGLDLAKLEKKYATAEGRLDPTKQKDRLEVRASVLKILKDELSQTDVQAERTLRFLEVTTVCPRGVDPKEGDRLIEMALAPLTALRSKDAVRAHLKVWSRVPLDGDEHKDRK